MVERHDGGEEPGAGPAGMSGVTSARVAALTEESAAAGVGGGRSFWPPSVLDIVLLGLLVALAYRTQARFLDGDTGAHLILGEWILRYHHIPALDILSLDPIPLLAHSWLAEVLFALSVRVGGLALLTVFACVVVLAVVGTVGATLRAHGADARIIALAMVGAAVLLGPGMSARPQIFTYLGMAALLAALEARRRVPTVWVALGFLLAANLHGGFAYGFAILGAYAVGDLLERDERARRDLLWLVVGIGASFVNPYGPGVYREVLGMLASSDVRGMVEEWARLQLLSRETLVLGLWVLLCAAAIVRTWRLPRLPRLFTLLGFGVGAALSARHGPPFGIVSAMLVGLHVREHWPAGKGGRYRLGDRIAAREPRLRPGPYVLGGLALTVLLALARPGVIRAARFSPDHYPVAAAEYARTHGLAGDPALFTDMEWGGYLGYALPGQVLFPSLFNTRDATMLRALATLYFAQPGWQGLAARFRWAVLPAGVPAVAALRGAGWEEVYRDGVAVVLTAPSS